MAKDRTIAESHLKTETRKIGAQVRKMLDKAADKVMDEFYADYPHPKYYDRTNNLKHNHKSRTLIKEVGPIYIDQVSVTFSSNYMSSYKRNERFVDNLPGGWNPDDADATTGFGWTFDEVNPAIIFELDFMQGYHGGKYWQKTRDWVATRGKKQSGKYWKKAKRMSPSPYKRMEEEFEEVKTQTQIYIAKKELKESIRNAMEADITEAILKASHTTGGK